MWSIHAHPKSPLLKPLKDNISSPDTNNSCFPTRADCWVFLPYIMVLAEHKEGFVCFFTEMPQLCPFLSKNLLELVFPLCFSASQLPLQGMPGFQYLVTIFYLICKINLQDKYRPWLKEWPLASDKPGFKSQIGLLPAMWFSTNGSVSLKEGVGLWLHEVAARIRCGKRGIACHGLGDSHFVAVVTVRRTFVLLLRDDNNFIRSNECFRIEFQKRELAGSVAWSCMLCFLYEVFIRNRGRSWGWNGGVAGEASTRHTSIFYRHRFKFWLLSFFLSSLLMHL